MNIKPGTSRKILEELFGANQALIDVLRMQRDEARASLAAIASPAAQELVALTFDYAELRKKHSVLQAEYAIRGSLIKELRNENAVLTAERDHIKRIYDVLVSEEGDI